MVMFSVICFLCFYTFPENLSIQSGFTLSQIGRGVLGGALVPPVGPSGAMMRYQIVNISLVLKV